MEEVIKACKGKIFCNFEAKDPDPEVITIMTKLIEQYELWDECIISSYNFEHLRRVESETNGLVKTGFIVWPPRTANRKALSLNCENS